MAGSSCRTASCSRCSITREGHAAATRSKHRTGGWRNSTVQRTTASGSWSKKEDADFTAVTVAYGVNAAHETTRHAVFGEVTRYAGSNSIFGRVEMRQSEIAVLTRRIDIDALRRDAVGAFTL